MSVNGSALRVDVVPLRGLDDRAIAAWTDLERRALEGNAYLSPHFVLPAARRLPATRGRGEPFAVMVSRGGGASSRLVGVGVFVRGRLSPRLPLPHWRAYGCAHTYRTGLLVDGAEAREVIRAFFRFFVREARWCHMVAFEDCRRDGEQAVSMAEAARELGATWFGLGESQRAVLVLREAGEAQVAAVMNAHRAKKLRRARRWLEQQGEVGWRVRVGAEVEEGSIERFLELEHLGWKGAGATSLRSQAAHEAFFREMAAGFRRDNRMFLTELTVGGAVVASTCNLTSGSEGFAFKIGWDPAYASGSPGILNELEFIKAAPALVGSLETIDSGASEGSFIERYWPARLDLHSGVFAVTAAGRVAMAAGERLARWRARLGSRGALAAEEKLES